MNDQFKNNDRSSLVLVRAGRGKSNFSRERETK